MTHDPLCPYTDRVEDEALRHVPCGICELIAKVREDMLAKCIAAVDEAETADEAIAALRFLSANADSDRNVSERRQGKS